MSKEKICPLMSRPIPFHHDDGSADASVEFIYCQREGCRLWIRVYSTENILQHGECAIALQPQMVDGLLRV